MVRKYNLRGSGKERIRRFNMLGSISGWHMHHQLDNERDLKVYGDHLQ